MPPKKGVYGRSIKDFFLPYTIPKNRIPVYGDAAEEIVVAPPKPPSPGGDGRLRLSSVSSTKPKHASQSSQRSSRTLTPTKKTPTKSPPERPDSRQLDKSTDSPLTSPTSSQWRVMQAVEIPSPKLRQTEFKQPEPKSEAAPQNAATSFSSLSSLSSLPFSTQSSSRRTTKGGMQAVTNSDSDSDSDSDELPDPSTFLPNKRRKMTPLKEDPEPVSGRPSTVRPSRKSTRQSEASKRSSLSGATTPYRSGSPPPRKLYTHSLLKMVKAREAQEKADARIMQMETQFEEAHRRRQEELKKERDLESGLKAAIADDSDEGERMMLAMERTEALQEEEKFYYFRGIDGRATLGTPTFPCSPDDPPWMKVFHNEQSRDQAFLTGFVAEMASREKLSLELHRWTASQLLREPRADLCEAYAETCAVVAESNSDSGDLCRLDAFYRLLEMRSHAGHEITQHLRSLPGLTSAPASLRYVLHMVERRWASPGKHATGRAVVFNQLALANIDEFVRRDPNLQNSVQNCIESLLCGPDDGVFDALCKGVASTYMTDAISSELQCRAILHLPALSGRSHAMRRYIALHFITNKVDQCYRDNVSSPDWLREVLERLTTAPEFAINESTDYNLLNSLISVLDIAIDAGFRTSPIESPEKSTTVPTNRPTWLSDEQSFNANIDALTSRLKQISHRIRDSGTSHLRRTEAKSAIERLIVRLEYGVRTRPKPRKGVFGGVSDGQRSFLSAFLKQTENEGSAIRVVLGDEKEGDAVTELPFDMSTDGESSSGSGSGSGSAVAGAVDE